MGSVWSRFLGSLWGRSGIGVRRFGIVLGSFWDRFGIILGSFWDRFRIVLGSFCDRFWVIFESIL